MVSVSWAVVETHLIIGGPRAVSAALALEFSEVLPDGVDKTNAGSGLICLELQHHTLVFDDDDDGEGSSVKALQRPRLLHSLVDGYGVRLLLDVLPAAHHHPDISRHLPQLPPIIALPLSERVVGFALQDTFFSSLEEAEDHRRDKCRKLIDHVQEERMRVIFVCDCRREGAVVDDSDVWGGRNEKVCGDETQKEFLRRTTVHIISPPNPAQLEMRILANHGPDKRFAFLRGRLLRV